MPPLPEAVGSQLFWGCSYRQIPDRMTTCWAWCRKRPFLIRPLENTLIKLLKSLDFYDELGRDKIAIGEQRPHPCPQALSCDSGHLACPPS